MELPKLMGDVSVHDLLEVAQSLNGCYSATDCTVRAQAIIEATILDAQVDYINNDDAADAADEHLLWLGAAEENLGKAARMHRENAMLEGLFDHLLLQLRTEFYTLFMPIYQDLSCREVTEESLDETYEALRLFTKQLKREETGVSTIYEKNRIRGMLHEAIVPLALMKVLDNAVVLPAPLRADSGETGGWLSHDLNFISYDPDGGQITGIKAWQIKGRADPLESSKDSYDLSSIDLIYARKNMSDEEWEEIVQGLISSNRRSHISPQTSRYAQLILEQSSVRAHTTNERVSVVHNSRTQASASHLTEQLGRLAQLFNKK